MSATWMKASLPIYVPLSLLLPLYARNHRYSINVKCENLTLSFWCCSVTSASASERPDCSSISRSLGSEASTADRAWLFSTTKDTRVSSPSVWIVIELTDIPPPRSISLPPGRRFPQPVFWFTLNNPDNPLNNAGPTFPFESASLLQWCWIRLLGGDWPDYSLSLQICSSSILVYPASWLC